MIHEADTGTGWHALLELGYQRRDDRTVPSLRRHCGPLRIQKHFEPEPGLCEHVIVHPPAGIAGGDRLAIEVDVGAAAEVRLTTPGAARWYRSSGAEASSRLTARVGEGALFEWLPQEQIVFDGAIGRSEVSFELARDATLIAWDVCALGRASLHPFERGTWRTRLDVVRAGTLVLGERGRVAGGEALRGSALGWGGRDVLATFLATGPKQLTAMVPTARAIPVAGSVGVTEIAAHGHSLLVARLLTDAVAPAWAWLRQLWALTRPALIGREACSPRIWRT